MQLAYGLRAAVDLNIVGFRMTALYLLEQLLRGCDRGVRRELVALLEMLGLLRLQESGLELVVRARVG